MGWFKKFLSFIFIIVMIYILVIYWFFSFNPTQFNASISGTSNFSSNNTGLVGMQFYSKMRFPEPNISYKIHNCPLTKSNEMELAFEILENETILDFYEVDFDEQISVTCDSKAKIKEGMFIGGEGGPTNITKTNNFNVIIKGSVLLIKETKCKNPNIPLHEGLHALGFNHSPNENNIMFAVVKCHQTMGEDIPNLINNLYSSPSYADLAFDNVSASMKSRFLDLNITIRNHGLKESKEATVEIYAGDKLIKELHLDPLEIGSGRLLILTNTLVTKINFDELKLFINYEPEELDKQNNRVSLQIKK